ncbi:Internalin-A precursor [Symmachiella dynata]|uniref:leucine-rich repeat domain-containing protein n=1 Tax=Symmachiella dynata TaxID=2527995 RepID=UPI00118AFFCE|nr:hypothetical protein [Symmachiella dynata]QDT49153.1 Internalin-A precursor [Symmachiella dynata]
MPDTENQKSRWPRSGTLLFIAVVLLIGGGVILVWLPYQKEQLVVAEVERLGGRTVSVIQRPFWIPDAVDDEYLKVFERVNEVDLSNTPANNATLESLSGLPHLTRLDLMNTQISDAGLERLCKLTKLEYLSLFGTGITNIGLEHIQQITSLSHLSLAHTKIDDSALKQMKTLTQLEQLTLTETQVSDVGIRHLYGMTNLKGIILADTQVTKSGLHGLHNSLPRLIIVGRLVSPASP